MRRLVPFLLAAIMASFPPIILLVCIGGLATTADPSWCTHHENHSGEVSCTSGDWAHPSYYAPVMGVSASSATYSYVSPSHHPMVVTAAAAAGLASWTTVAQSSDSSSTCVGGGRCSGKPGQPQQASTTGDGATSLAAAASSSSNQHPLTWGSGGGGGQTVDPVPTGQVPADTLKVQILAGSRGKSSDCSHALVEFSNAHQSDTIIIHSAYIEPTAVFPQTGASGIGDPSRDVTFEFEHDGPDSSPPTFHKDVYEGRQLQVPPQTAITIPVSIIPHRRKPPDLNQGTEWDYRHSSSLSSTGGNVVDHISYLGSSNSAAANNVTTSSWNAHYNPAIHADLLDMLESNTHSRESTTTTSDGGTTTTAMSAYQSLVEQTNLHSTASSIHETLVAYTSWGFVQMRVPYVCSPTHSLEYEFGLPNNLMFLDSGGGWYARFNTTPPVELAYMFGNLGTLNPTKDTNDPFVYKVYMNNPTEYDLQIYNVYTTKPNLVGVEVQAYAKGLWWSSKANNDGTHYPLRGTPHPPKTNNIYVATVRLRPNQFTFDMMKSSTHIDLGFLVIDTNLGAFFSIGLDYIPNDGRSGIHAGGPLGVIHGVGENMTTLNNDISLVRDHVMSVMAQSNNITEATVVGDVRTIIPNPQPKPNITVVKSYHAIDDGKDGAARHAYIDRVTQVHSQIKEERRLRGVTMPDHRGALNTTAPILVTPTQIDFGSITTGSRMVRIPIKMVNVLDQPLRIMRISVAMTAGGGGGNITDTSLDDRRMDIGVDFNDGKQMNGTSSKKEAYILPQDVLLPTNVEITIYVWCKFNAHSPTSLGGTDAETASVVPRFYTGSIIVHATEDMHVTYREWEEHRLLLEHSPSLLPQPAAYLLQIPFQGSVLPGNLGAPTQSLLFPINYQVLPVDERNKILSSSGTPANIPKYYDRELDVTNNFAVPISITGIQILDGGGPNNLNNNPNNENDVDAYCKKRFSVTLNGSTTAASGQKWKGLMVRYHFQDDDDYYYSPLTTAPNGVVGTTAARKCVLSLETDKVSKQSLPLIIYSGEVIVDIDRPEGGQLTVQCLVKRVDNPNTVVVSRSGMPCMEEWLANTVEGTVLSQAITTLGVKHANRKPSHCIGGTPKETASLYFQSLSSFGRSKVSSSSSSLDNTGKSQYDSSLQPIVLSFGANPTGTTTSQSIYLTNLNHAPVEITLPTASIASTPGGKDVAMSIQIGIDRTDFPGGLRDMMINSNDQQKSDIAYTLYHSPPSKKLFEKFKYKFNILPSPRAMNTELGPLFNSHLIDHYFSNATQYLSAYVDKKDTTLDKECGACGYILSTDGSYVREICKRRAGSKKKYTIPPGGVARFNVTITTPHRSNLRNDVMSFVATGLALETNFGQSLPIVITYSAINGMLRLRPTNEGGEGSKDVVRKVSSAVKVPLTFRDAVSTTTPGGGIHSLPPNTTTSDASGIHQAAIDKFYQRQGVSLSIESSFSQDMYLSEIRSCNKWFNVFLPDSNAAAREFFGGKGRNSLLIPGSTSSAEDSGDGWKSSVPLGKVLSALSCGHPSGDRSFWSCALAWLENRDEIQPPVSTTNTHVGGGGRCGLSEVDIFEEITRNANRTDINPEQVPEMMKKITTAKTDAIGALRDVVAFLAVRYPNVDNENITSTYNAAGGYIHYSRLHMFHHARKMWDVVVKLGLNIITGHVDAKTVYLLQVENTTLQGEMERGEVKKAAFPHTNQQQKQQQPAPLSIPVLSVLLQSPLEIPKLFNEGHSGTPYYDVGPGLIKEASSDSYSIDPDWSASNVGIVNFDTTHVGDVTSRTVPIFNPTSTTIRVRLAAMDSADGSFDKERISNLLVNKNVFVQQGGAFSSSLTYGERHPWWTGGSYWMSDNDGDGHLISASHNVTIKSGAGAYVSLLNPALHAITAFVLGCGKRCGLNDNQYNQNNHVHNLQPMGEEKNFSPIGAGSADGGDLVGRYYENGVSSTTLLQDYVNLPAGQVGTKPKLPQKALGMLDPPPFSLGRNTQEVTIPPYGAAELGPVYFRPPGRRMYEGTIFIENSLTGFEEVTVRGQGGWEKLVFLDGTLNDNEGGDIEFRFGKSTLVFPGSQTSNGEAVMKSVRLVNQGDFPVHVSGIYMGSSEVKHFTHKRRHPSFSSNNAGGPSGDSDSSGEEYGKRKKKRCSSGRFVLPGCVESHHNILTDLLTKVGHLIAGSFGLLFAGFKSVIAGSTLPLVRYSQDILEKLNLSSPVDHANNKTIMDRIYKEGFTLQPNAMRHVYVAHFPDCTHQTSYASVIFELEDRNKQGASRLGGREDNKVGSWQQTFRRQKLELLVGYDMSNVDYMNCVPYTPPESDFVLNRKIRGTVPRIVQDVLSFGLTRWWKDAYGKPYMPPVGPIEITLVTAALLLVLLILSIDMIFNVELSSSRKTCPSWKPTCRCLARADPTSSDLISIGKEQTKHVTLSRFKKEGAVLLPSSCVHPDGSFGRERKAGSTGGGGGGSGTHSEAIFDRLNLVNESKMAYDNEDEGKQDDVASMPGVLPCGLGWRAALQRGVGWTASSPEVQYLTRTRDQYVRRQQQQQAEAQKAAANRKKVSFSSTPSSKTTSRRDTAAANTTINGHPAPPQDRPLPRERKVEQQQQEAPSKNKVLETPPTNGEDGFVVVADKNHVYKKVGEEAKKQPKVSTKGASNSTPGTSTVVEKSSSVDKATGKQIKQQQKVDAETTDSKGKIAVGDVKGKQKQQRNEGKAGKVKTETKKDVSKKEDSSSKPVKSTTAGQKARPAKEASSKSKQDEKVLEQAAATAPLSSKESSAAAQTKQTRQTKKEKATNGSKSVDQPQQAKGKKDKQKVASKKGATASTSSNKAPPKSPMSAAAKSKQQQKLHRQNSNEFPPLSSALSSPVRPPPGLVAPPGFLGQPDLPDLINEGGTQSTPSSPSRSAPSPQRSPMVQSMLTSSGGLPGVDILSSPTPIQPPVLPLEDGRSSLFQGQSSNDSSPSRGGGSDALAFRPHSLLEASSMESTNNSDAPPAVQALLGVGNNNTFDVSNFLDGILSEPKTSQQQVQPRIRTESSEAQKPTAQTTIGGISLDPWSGVNSTMKTTNSSNPLAALRGASTSHDESPSVIAGIPLGMGSNGPSLLSATATSSLQSSGNTASYNAEPAIASFVSDDGGDGDDGILEPDSFYSQLLGED